MNDEDEEGWTYLPHAERQVLQRQLNGQLFAYMSNMDAAIKRAEEIADDLVERTGLAEGSEPKLIRIVDDA